MLPIYDYRCCLPKAPRLRENQALHCSFICANPSIWRVVAGCLAKQRPQGRLNKRRGKDEWGAGVRVCDKTQLSRCNHPSISMLPDWVSQPGDSSGPEIRGIATDARNEIWLIHGWRALTVGISLTAAWALHSSHCCMVKQYPTGAVTSVTLGQIRELSKLDRTESELTRDRPSGYSHI